MKSLPVVRCSPRLVASVASPFFLVLLFAQSPAQNATRSAGSTNPLAATWTSSRPVIGLKMQYTFDAKGRYLALLGAMDHQGDYRREGRRVFVTPDVVAQRSIPEWLKEVEKNPDGLNATERAFVRTIAKPYRMTLSADGKTLTGPGFKVVLDPKAKPLF